MYESRYVAPQDRAAIDDHPDVASQDANQAAFIILWGGLMLFLLLWAWIAIKSCYELSHRGPPNQTLSSENVVVRELSKKERKERLIYYFADEKHQLELTPDILPTDATDEKKSTKEEGKVEDDDYDLESSQQMIRLKLSGEEFERVFSSICAICLDPYKVGDHIVWSSSADCRHIFHRDCLVDGLSRVKNDKTPCPCCRLNFCDFPKDSDTKCAAPSCETQ